MPTARHIWNSIQTAESKVRGALEFNESLVAYERLLNVVEQAGQELFDALQQEHRSSIAREADRGLIAFGARRIAIERVGLSEVLQFQMAWLEGEEAEWRKKLESAK